MANRPTVVVKQGGVYYKAFKVWIGADGSYYVTVPYHTANSATLLKITANYDVGTNQRVPMEDVVDLASLDNERLKLSHHPDGFCQFSGQGVMSGKDAAGNPRGVAILTSPLEGIGGGPAFGVVIQGIHEFETIETPDHDDYILDGDDAFPIVPDQPTGYSIEGHYFQPQLRRFIYRERNEHLFINIPHPWGPILKLRVVLPPVSCDYPGFIGLDIFKTTARFPKNGFSLNGPGEKRRRNEHGEAVADILSCICPKIEAIEGARNVNYPPRTPDK